MDCIREAENYLRYYRDLHKSIKHADRIISQLIGQSAPKPINAIVLEATGVRASNPRNTLNQMYQLQKWQEIRERTLTEIAKVDDVLDSICIDPGCERYKELLYMWYVEKLDKETIAEALGYSKNSKQTVYDMRRVAIKKFSVSLFGIEALQAI